MVAQLSENRFGADIGHRGEVRLGGRVAAAFEKWELEPGEQGWKLRSTLTRADPYLLGLGGPYEVRVYTMRRDRTHPDWADTAKPVPTVERQWRWRGIEQVEVTGTHLYVRGDGNPEVV